MVLNILLGCGLILVIFCIGLSVWDYFLCKSIKKTQQCIVDLELSLQISRGELRLCKRLIEMLETNFQNIENNSYEMSLIIKQINCDYNVWANEQKCYTYPKDYIQEHLKNLIKTGELYGFSKFFNMKMILEAI
jgi:hypothetical protein